MLEVRRDERPCPACESHPSDEAGEKTGFRLCRCRRCRTLFTAAIPQGRERQDYDRGYHLFQTPAFVATALDRVIQSFASVRLTNQFLDIGFGAGDLLSAAARQGWTAHGVEVSREACERLRSSGFRIFNGTLGDAAFPDASFDVVTAVEVLEHVDDPRALVAEARRVLRPGGAFWATTPHVRGLSGRALGLRWSIVSPPEHLQLFSVQGLRAILQRAGFETISIQTHGANPYELLSAGWPRSGSSLKPMRSTDRVQSSRSLNEFMSSGRFRPVVKVALNHLLDATRMGDGLKARAS